MGAKSLINKVVNTFSQQPKIPRKNLATSITSKTGTKVSPANTIVPIRRTVIIFLSYFIILHFSEESDCDRKKHCSQSSAAWEYCTHKTVIETRIIIEIIILHIRRIGSCKTEEYTDSRIKRSHA